MQRTPKPNHRRGAHRANASSNLCKSLVLLSIATGVSMAQVGPNPAEIPSVPVQSNNRPTERSVDRPANRAGDRSGEPSLSESVRPAMDEILIAQAKARQGDSSASIASGPRGVRDEPSTLQGDLHTSTIDNATSDTRGLPIGRPAERSAFVGASQEDAKSAVIDKGWMQTIIALSGVILLILGLGQLYKRLARAQGGLAGQFGAGGSAPTGIIEVLGRYSISRGMTLVVIKFDRKILLLSHSTSGKGKSGRGSTMQTLCELDDPEDVASVLLKARNAAGDSIAKTFEQTLQEAGDFTDDQLHDIDMGYAEVNPVRFPAPRTSPVRTITNDEGDRVELWSSGQDAAAAAGVLRKRLSSMRREQQG